MGSYVFFLDFFHSDHAGEALSALQGMTQIKDLGRYPEQEVPEWK
jgi:prephenate dehydratase